MPEWSPGAARAATGPATLPEAATPAQHLTCSTEVDDGRYTETRERIPAGPTEPVQTVRAVEHPRPHQTAARGRVSAEVPEVEAAIERHEPLGDPSIKRSHTKLHSPSERCGLSRGPTIIVTLVGEAPSWAVVDRASRPRRISPLSGSHRRW